MLTEDGVGQHLDIKTESLDLTGYFMVSHITEDHEGRIWISSAGGGIVRIDGWTDNQRKWADLKCRRYTTPTTNVTACFEDSRHQLWAISATGLLKYLPTKDCFEAANEHVHMAGKKALAINEDRYGALWLATDQALVRIDKQNEGSIICFTEQDGLPSTSFMPNATFSHDGWLFFGTADGVAAFQPNSSYSTTNEYHPNLIVTDILIDGTSVRTLDSLSASRISALQPMYTHHITIPPNARRWGVEFALLSYSRQHLVQYAYRLEGFDHDWQYTDGETHCAVFQHIPSGTYKLHLRAADSYGQWHDLPYTIQVNVLAPWYATWWAYLIYISIATLLLLLLWRYRQMQRELKASRRFSTILQSTKVDIEPQVSTQSAISAEETISSMPSTVQRRNAEFVASATQLVRNHLSDSNYNRDGMAADLGMSVSSLYTRLRECTDLSIQTFIQTIRLNAAYDILRSEPSIRISDLAYRVGFNTPKYFSQCFKKEFGMLPGDFVKQNKK